MRKLVLVAVGLCGMIGQGAWAQGDPSGTPPLVLPTDPPQLTPNEARLQEFQSWYQARQEWDAAVERQLVALAEEQRLRDKQKRAEVLHKSLTDSGLQDEAVEAALVEFMERQETARHSVRAAGTRLDEDLRYRRGASDTQIAEHLAAYQAAVTSSRADREAALQILEARTHFREQPRLMAWLTLNGFIGDEAALTRPTIEPFSPAIMAGLTHVSSRMDAERLVGPPPYLSDAPAFQPAVPLPLQ